MRRLAVLALVGIMAGGSCVDGGDGSAAPTDAATVAESAASATTDTPPDPPDLADTIGDMLAESPPPTVDAVGSTSISEAALASIGEPLDEDLFAAASATEASLLRDALALLPPGDATTTTSTVALGFARHQAGSGGTGFGGLGVALVSVGDSATGTGVTASGSSGSAVTTATGRGSIDLSVEIGSVTPGVSTARVSFEVEVTGADGTSSTVTVRGQVAGRACPDESGLLELEFDGEVSAAARPMPVTSRPSSSRVWSPPAVPGCRTTAASGSRPRRQAR